MAALPSLDEKLTNLLKRTFPTIDSEATSDPAKLSIAVYGTAKEEGKPPVQYSDAEKGEINQWVITASHLGGFHIRTAFRHHLP